MDALNYAMAKLRKYTLITGKEMGAVASSKTCVVWQRGRCAHDQISPSRRVLRRHCISNDRATSKRLWKLARIAAGRRTYERHAEQRAE